MLKTRRRRAIRLALAVVLAAACAAASERSERLATDAGAAYNARRYAEAQTLFAEATEADPDDAAAYYGLGMALTKLERWEGAAAAFERALALRPEFDEARRALVLLTPHRRASVPTGPEEVSGVQVGQPVRRDLAHALTTATRLAEKRWELHAGGGVEYDSNVVLASHDFRGKRADAAFLLAAGGRYDVVHHENALVRLHYDLEQSLHPELQDFDLRTNRLSGSASHAVTPWFWLGIEGGYVHHALGSHAYLENPFVLPFATLIEGTRGRTQLYYRHGQPAYLSLPFKGVRDGQTNSAGLTQLFLSPSGRYASVGYQYENEQPRRSIGDDYRFHADQVHVGVGFPGWWRTAFDVAYVYRNEDYTEPNSVVNFRKTRSDGDHYVFAAVRRALSEHFALSVAYYGTIHTSNIEPFDYRRHQVALLVQAVY